MFKDVKLKNIEIIAIVLALVVTSFVSGYFAGRGGKSKTVTVRVAGKSEKTTSEEPSVSSAGSSESTVEPTVKKAPGKVNINTADEEKLATLPGIGETTALKIISYREKNGPFSSIEDIINVHGIGKATYEAIMDQITVDEEIAE